MWSGLPESTGARPGVTAATREVITVRLRRECLHQRAKVSGAVDECYDGHLVRTYAVDQSVIPGEQLTVRTIVELWDPAAAIGEGCERLSGFQEIADEPRSSRWRFFS